MSRGRKEMEVEVVLKVPIRCLVEGAWNPAEPDAGLLEGFWEVTNVKISSNFVKGWSINQQLSTKDWEAAEDALERAAKAEQEEAS